MQVSYPSTGEILIVVWFALSVFVEVISGIVFWFWIRRQGVKLSNLMVKMPGNMERAYLAWCRSHGQSPNMRIIRFRAISTINVLVAGIIFVLILSTR
jgi:hypothetical protein